MLPMLLVFREIFPDTKGLSASRLQEIKEKFSADIAVKRDHSGPARSVTLTVDGPQSQAFEHAMKRWLEAHQHSEILYQNSLVPLVSAGEWFLSQLLHSHFDMYPESAGIADKSLKLSELQNFEGIEDARRYLVDLKVEEIMRGSFGECLEYLKRQFKLDLGYLENHFDYIIEICLRRNLLVHNGGRINQIYRRKIPPKLQ